MNRSTNDLCEEVAALAREMRRGRREHTARPDQRVSLPLLLSEAMGFSSANPVEALLSEAASLLALAESSVAGETYDEPSLHDILNLARRKIEVAHRLVALLPPRAFEALSGDPDREVNDAAE